jgi:hypothetical protein
MPSSGYVANSFTAGQQPTTTIWNELWANDASFNSGAGFNDGIIITRHIAAGIQLRQLESLPYKFSAYVSAGSQTGATFPVVFQTKIFDTGGNYNNSTGVFTAPISGFYQFNAALCLPQSASAGYSTDLYKNSAPYNAPTFRGQAVVPSYTGATIVTTISVLAQLVAGDTMNVGSIYANGGTISYALTGENFFQGFLISAS